MPSEFTMSYLTQGYGVLKLAICYVVCFLNNSLKIFILDVLYGHHLLRLLKCLTSYVKASRLQMLFQLGIGLIQNKLISLVSLKANWRELNDSPQYVVLMSLGN